MINNDIISKALTANIVINQNNYINFYPAAQTSAVINANSRMSDAFSYFNYNGCGPILVTKLISGGKNFTGFANIAIQEGNPTTINTIPTVGNTGANLRCK